MLKRAYRALISFDREQLTVAAFVGGGGGGSSPHKVLDVGCGYGRNAKFLRSRGINVTGVEINPEIVRANVVSGLPCMTVDEFARTSGNYNVLLMSHVIEHFPPRDLLHFVDGYLDRLEVGGSLVIATPLMSSNFYDDFDHVRPYQPMGLQMVFGGDRAQVQYYARNKLALRDLWFRRSPWRLHHHRARCLLGPMTRVLQATDVAAAIAFRASGGLLGRVDGWVGRFEKIA